MQGAKELLLARQYLRQRGKLWSDQRVHRVGSAGWLREHIRRHSPPVPKFLLKA